jgi:hypothetical protein
MLEPYMDKNEKINDVWKKLKKEIENEYQNTEEIITPTEIIEFLEKTIVDYDIETLFITPQNKENVEDLKKLDYQILTEEVREVCRTIGVSFRKDNGTVTKEFKKGAINAFYQYNNSILQQIKEYEENFDARINYSIGDKGKITIDYLDKNFNIELYYQKKEFYFTCENNSFLCKTLKEENHIQKFLKRIEKSSRMDGLFDDENHPFFNQYLYGVKKDTINPLFKELRKFYSFDDIEKMSAKNHKKQRTTIKIEDFSFSQEIAKIFDIFLIIDMFSKQVLSFKTKEEVEKYAMEKERKRIQKVLEIG